VRFSNPTALTTNQDSFVANELDGMRVHLSHRVEHLDDGGVEDAARIGRRAQVESEGGSS